MSSHTELKKAVRGTVKPSVAKAPQATNPPPEQAAYLPLLGRGWLTCNSRRFVRVVPGRRAPDALVPSLSRNGIDPVVTARAFLAAEVSIFTPGTTPVSGPGVQRPPESRIPLSSASRPYRCSSPWWTYRVLAALIFKPLYPVAAGMDKYLLTRSNLMNNHLSMAGITQQAPDVAVWDVPNGYPFPVFSDGVFNRFELHHDRTPVQIHWCT